MKLKNQTYKLDNPIYIAQALSLAGPYEAKGNLKEFYDFVMDDDEWGCKSREMTEIKMQKFVVEELLKKSRMAKEDINCYLGGDLLNQLTPTAFSARSYSIPYFGLYTACATFSEALIVGSMFLEHEMEKVICITSSHFATAERQYRYPLELGTQPTPASQWTVTGCGSVLLDKTSNSCPKIESFTIGKIIDLDCTDVNNMGMAMAPAAADTIITHFKETNRPIDYYDLILTGDLGKLGKDTLAYLCKEEGLNIEGKLNDCGSLVYSKEQKRGQGGSGAGCCSLVFTSYFYKKLINKELCKILFIPTGALLSKDSPLQGESIPGIAHAISIEV